MNKKLIVVACMALILAGCGDKDDAASGSAEPGMMDKPMDATSDTMGGAGEMMNEESAGEAASDAAGTAGEAAGNAAGSAEESAEGAVDAAGGAMQDSGAVPAE